MMDLLKLLTNLSSNQTALNQLNQSVDAKPTQVQRLVQLGLPVLMEALNRNVSTPQGAQALTSALEQHQEDNTDDLTGFIEKVDTEDGSKILQHVFENKNQMVQNNLSKQTGLNTNQVGSLMAKLAPLMLGALGNQKKAQNLDATGVASLASTLSKGLQQSGGGNLFSLAKQLLDADKDGDIMDDLGNLFRKFKR
jgi:hypothetical protein